MIIVTGKDKQLFKRINVHLEKEEITFSQVISNAKELYKISERIKKLEQDNALITKILRTMTNTIKSLSHKK